MPSPSDRNLTRNSGKPFPDKETMLLQRVNLALYDLGATSLLEALPLAVPGTEILAGKRVSVISADPVFISKLAPYLFVAISGRSPQLQLILDRADVRRNLLTEVSAFSPNLVLIDQKLAHGNSSGIKGFLQICLVDAFYVTATRIEVGAKTSSRDDEAFIPVSTQDPADFLVQIAKNWAEAIDRKLLKEVRAHPWNFSAELRKRAGM